MDIQSLYFLVKETLYSHPSAFASLVVTVQVAMQHNAAMTHVNEARMKVRPTPLFIFFSDVQVSLM